LRERRGDFVAFGFPIASCEDVGFSGVAFFHDRRRGADGGVFGGEFLEFGVDGFPGGVERAVVLGSTEIILPEDLPETLLEATAPAGVVRLEFHEAVKEAKREIVLNALDGAGGNCAEAARLLGLHPNNLHRLIRNLNLKPGLSRTTKRTWPCQLLPRA